MRLIAKSSGYHMLNFIAIDLQLDLFFLFLIWGDTSHASAEASLTGWPNAQPQLRIGPACVLGQLV